MSFKPKYIAAFSQYKKIITFMECKFKYYLYKLQAFFE